MSINTELTALADAIRAKSGTEGKLTISGMTTAVNNIVINAGDDIDLSGVTVTADKMLSGIVAVGATGEKVTGNIPTVTASSDGKKVTVPVGYIAAEQSFDVGSDGYDTSAVTVTADTMLAGKIAVGKNGETITGTIPTVTASVSGDKVTVPVGYIATEQTFDVGGSGIDTTTSVPPTAADVRLGKEFFANGEKYTGTMPDAVISTETLDGGDIDTRLTISAGYLENDFTIDYLSSGFKYLPFVTATAEDIREGMVGADVEGNPITGTLVVGGDTPAGGGAFDLVKVTEYIPYSPAYSSVTGVAISGLVDESEDGDGDFSPLNGFYPVTEDTANESDWRNKVYKRTDNNSTLSYYFDEYEPDYSYWSINDTNGNTVFVYYTTEDLPSGTNQWTNYDWGYDRPITSEPTIEEFPEVSMVLKCSVATSYDTEELTWNWADEEVSVAAFEVEPKVGQIFAYVKDNSSTVLVGSSLGYDPSDLESNAVFYCKNEEYTGNADSGQELISVENSSKTQSPPEVYVKGGVKCLGKADGLGDYTMLKSPITDFKYELCSDCTIIGTMYGDGYRSSGDRSNPISHITGNGPIYLDGRAGYTTELDQKLWGLLTDAGELESGTIEFGDRDDSMSYDGSKLLKQNRWYQIATIFRNGQPELWINGEKVQQAKAKSHHTRTDGIRAITMPLRVSTFNGWTNQSYISRCYLYDRALSENELKYLWRSFSSNQIPVFTGIPSDYGFRASFTGDSLIAESGQPLTVSGSPSISIAEYIPCAKFNKGDTISFEIDGGSNGAGYYRGTLSAWIYIDSTKYTDSPVQVMTVGGLSISISKKSIAGCPIQPTGWNHIAITGVTRVGSDGSSGKSESVIWINGVKVATRDDLILYGNGVIGSSEFEGYVGEVLYYSEDLLDDQIKMLAAEYVNGFRVPYTETPSNGLVFRAKFDGSANTTTGQTINTVGDPKYTVVDGVPCVRFNGTNYMTFSDAGFPSGTSPRTIAFWCYVDSLSQYSNPLIFGYGTRSSRQFCGVFIESGNRIGFSGHSSNINSDGTISVKRWHHIVCTKGADGVEKIFIDGKQAGSGTTQKNTVLGLGQIADTTDSDSYRYAGCLAEALVYDRELSYAEIAALYSQFAEK